MKDSASEVFGRVFELLAEKSSRDRRDMASELFEMLSEFDVEPGDLNVDEALVDLELAERCDSCDKVIYQDQEHLTEDCE